MSCDEVRRTLLEGDIEARRAVADHLSDCPACRRVAEAVDEADADLHEGLSAVLDRPLSTPIRPRRISMTVPALIVAAVASLTLAALPVFTDAVPDLGITTDAPDLSAVQAAEAIPAEALSASDWAARRDRLHALWLAEGARLEVDDRFALAVQLGRTAALASEPVAPYFEGGDNVFFGVARDLDEQADGRLLATVGDPEVAAAIGGPPPATEEGVEALLEAADDAGRIPWNALSTEEWVERRDELADAFVAHRERLSQAQILAVLVQIGRAAENANDPDPRFYPEVGGRKVNGAWLAAAGLEVARPGLLAEEVSDEQVRGILATYVASVRDGEQQALGYREAFAR